MILALRTDQPTAEVYLLDSSGKVISQKIWTADRQLSKQLLATVMGLLKKSKVDLKDLTEVVVYQGPGSFTGLRIGVATANSLAYGLGIPIVGASTEGWQDKGVKQLAKTKEGRFVTPIYGQPPRITQPKV